MVMRTPAGLFDENFEWFTHEGSLYAFYKGKKLTYKQVPVDIKDIFFAEMLKDESYIMKNRVFTDQVFQNWIILNYGLLNDVPDLETATGKTNNENVAKKYHLSSREIDVIKELSNGDPDKWNCDKLHITVETARTHIRNIRQKLNVHSKTAIAKFAFDNSLL